MRTGAIIFFLYLIGISVFSSVVTILDKIAARRRAMRVPESVLLLLAALGGSVSMYVTMFIIHHKIRHRKFKFGIPAIFVMQIALLLGFIWYWAETHP